jgi:hypothetical protein
VNLITIGSPVSTAPHRARWPRPRMVTARRARADHAFAAPRVPWAVKGRVAVLASWARPAQAVVALGHSEPMCTVPFVFFLLCFQIDFLFKFLLGLNLLNFGSNLVFE